MAGGGRHGRGERRRCRKARAARLPRTLIQVLALAFLLGLTAESGRIEAQEGVPNGPGTPAGPGMPLPQSPAPPPPPAEEPPYVLLRADEVIYDQNTGVVTAKGDVEISHENEVLRADTVIYDEKKDTVTAVGNVVLLESTGEVVFAERAEFSDGMKEGTVQSFRMLLTDDSRLAAASGTRTGGVVTVLNKAVFSPCELCEDDPTRAPLWRIRSVQVIHDSEQKEIEHKDAFLEFYGIPVFYTPYLSHPDPSVKRRSGFLAPSYSSDSRFGYVLQTPYFWEIAPNEDLTLTPYFMTEEAPVLAANYRRRFVKGAVEVDSSLTRPDRRGASGEKISGTDTRGHLFVTGEYDHDAIWRTRYQFQHASDDTYLRRYRFPTPTNQTLTSKFNTEGFMGHNYAQVAGYSFQGLRATDDPGESPLVLPYAQYNYISAPAINGAFLTADTSLVAITRSEGADSRRVSLNGGWHLPHTAWTGEIYTLSATLQTDVYSVNDVTTDSGAVESGATGRVFPQLMAEWRYPFARPGENSMEVIQPMAAVVLAPYGGNPEKIPNEDSQAVEFDSTNLFAPNRFPGVDRVEGGPRFIYGVNWSLYGNNGGVIEAFAGQSYRLRREDEFAENSGLREQLSDVVGHLRLAPSDWIDLLYRFRFDTDTSSARRSELGFTVGPPGFKIGADYLFLDETSADGEFGDREELTLRFNAEINAYWRAYGGIRENLAENGGTISEHIGFAYTDECFTFLIQGTRDFTEDRDLKPSDTLFFRLIFKHLGEFEGGS